MNSKRSYLDTLNAGRQRRPAATLEQITQSLQNLESRLDRGRPPVDEPLRRQEPGSGLREALGLDTRGREAPRPQPAPEPQRPTSYQSMARDFDRIRSQEEGIASVGKIAGEIRSLREDLRQQLSTNLQREFETLRGEVAKAMSARGAGSDVAGEFNRIHHAIQSLSQRADDRGAHALRDEIEQVKHALESLAREDTVRSSERRWDDFDRRWSAFESRVDAQRATLDPEIASLADRLQTISEAVSNLPDSLSLRSLEDKVRTLASAVDHFVRQQEHQAPQTFRLIDERLDEISRAIVAATAAAQSPVLDTAPFERLEARISGLARQIEEVAEDRPGAEMISRLNALTQRVNDLSAQAAAPEEALDRLSRQIEDLLDQRPGAEVIERLSILSQRVDALAAKGDLPEQAMERLARQIFVIAEKLDNAPVPPDADTIFQGIEQRFDVLSAIVERRQDDAIEHGNTMFRDLESRLADMAERIDLRAAEALDGGRVMSAIDARFSELTERIASSDTSERQDRAIHGLEKRLEAISARIEASSAQAAVDPALINSLQSQVAALSAQLERPAAPIPELEEIGPRLEEIERSIAGSRDTLLEAARQAAESAVRTLAGSQTHTAAVSGLSQDLRALESLTRRSDERNGRTFEAIHDTLIKIVDRLGAMDGTSPDYDSAAPTPALSGLEPEPLRAVDVRDVPPLQMEQPARDDDALDDPLWARPEQPSSSRTPAEAAAEAAMAALSAGSADDQAASPRSLSLFGGLGKALGGSKPAAPARPVEAPVTSMMDSDVGLDEPLDPMIANRPLEPGSGTPDLNAIMKRVREERGQTAKAGDPDAAKADFIAAARRAAQAAAAEAEVMKRAMPADGSRARLRLGSIFGARRKLILGATAAVVLAVGGVQLGRALMSDSAPGVSSSLEEAPATDKAESTPPASDAMVAQETTPAAAESAEPMAAVADTAPASDKPAASMAPEPQDLPAASDEPARTDAGKIPDAVGSLPAATSAPETPAPAQPVATTPSTPATASDIPVEAGPVPLREAAAAGDSKALFEIGQRYADGRGVKADLKAAADWYEKAAELGFAPAQYRLASFYEKAMGVQRDIAKAKTWYQLAAAQGNVSAMHNLAVLYAMGADGTADNDSAVRWFTEAANFGVKDSQFNLGILAAKGIGMGQSLEESYKWFAIVAKSGDRDAVAKRDEIANALRPEQLTRARATVDLWKAKPVNPEANTVEIPESWQESPGTTASVDMKKAVANIQKILNKNGYTAGSADGVMGEKTKNAIIAFQKDNNLPANGVIDETLVKALLAHK